MAINSFPINTRTVRLDQILAAEGYADAAEAARDAAQADAKVYPSTAAGLAAVAEGEQFMVVVGDEIIRYEDVGGVATERARYPTAASVLQPNWAGIAPGWIDPFFRQIDVGDEYIGRSRWVSPFDGVYTLVDGGAFKGRKLRRDDTSDGQFGGPRIWLDDMGAEVGDTIAVRALISGSGVTGSIAYRFMNAAGSSLGGQVTMRSPSGTTSVVTGATPVLFGEEAIVPAGAVSLRVYSFITVGTGTIDIEALWAQATTLENTPVWPAFGGEPLALPTALNAESRLDVAEPRIALLEDAQGYLVKTFGGVTPDVETDDVTLAVTGVLANSSYGAVFQGWAERYVPAGVSFNAVRIRSLGRKSDVAEANFWRTIKVVVRAAASADAHLGASSTLVAVGETLVDPSQSVLEDVVVILRDPSTGAVVTLDDGDLGAEYLIGTHFTNRGGGAAYGSPHRGTMTNALGSPASYYIATGNPETGDWIPFTGNWRLGVDHLLLTDPEDVLLYSPQPGFLADLGGGVATAVPDVFNAAALRQYAKRITAGEAVVLAMLGDSWTNTTYRLISPLRNLLDTVYDFSAPGWVSANTNLTAPAMATRVRSGTWTNVRSSASAAGPDNAHASTTDTAAYITFASTSTVGKFYLHYVRQPGGGTFSWAVDGGSPTVVDTDGVAAYDVIEIDGPGTLRVDVDTAGSAGVVIAGCDVRNDTAGQFVLHKLGSGGARADHFAQAPDGYLEAAYGSIAPDVLMICLGTNDHAASIGINSFRSSIEAIIDRIRSTAPVADVVLVGPGPNNNTGAYLIDDYISALYEIAIERDVTFINLKSSLGSYADANARGLYEDASHPNTAGGLVIGRALWRSLFKE
jgi:lysophospholipase L1-like esterase